MPRCRARARLADSINATAPERIELMFNEPVQLLGLRLIDAAGQRPFAGKRAAGARRAGASGRCRIACRTGATW